MWQRVCAAWRHACLCQAVSHPPGMPDVLCCAVLCCAVLCCAAPAVQPSSSSWWWCPPPLPSWGSFPPSSECSQTSPPLPACAAVRADPAPVWPGLKWIADKLAAPSPVDSVLAAFPPTTPQHHNTTTPTSPQPACLNCLPACPQPRPDPGRRRLLRLEPHHPGLAVRRGGPRHQARAPQASTTWQYKAA